MNKAQIDDQVRRPSGSKILDSAYPDKLDGILQGLWVISNGKQLGVI